MLSKRLKEIANLVDKNKVVYDVGSDHGLLPCFLVLNNICPKAYASDNKQGPLNKAIENIKNYHLEDKVIPVLADGIEKISGDVDIITIAGMGFYTVKHILENKDLSKYDKLIIQVNKDSAKLRKWLSENNFLIIDELIVKDDFYYEIEVIDPKQVGKLNELECKYGPINLKRKETVFIDYLKDKRAKLKKVNESAKKPSIDQEIKEIDIILK